MIKVTEQVEIAAPIDAVWSYLGSPEQIVKCIPGAALSQDNGNGNFQGSLTISFGPTRVAFHGDVGLEYEQENHICRAKARGRDQRGMSNAMGSGVFTLSPAAIGTLLSVEGSFELTGPLAPFAKSAGPTVVRALLGDFAKNLSALATVDDAPQGSNTNSPSGSESEHSVNPKPASAVPPLPSSMSAFKLLVSIIKVWWRGLFTRRSN